MIRILLIACGLVELLIGVSVLTAIRSDIQIIVALCAFGFGLTHLGIAALMATPRKIKGNV